MCQLCRTKGRSVFRGGAELCRRLTLKADRLMPNRDIKAAPLYNNTSPCSLLGRCVTAAAVELHPSDILSSACLKTVLRPVILLRCSERRMICPPATPMDAFISTHLTAAWKKTGSFHSTSP
jgi:hypothetical protein